MPFDNDLSSGQPKASFPSATVEESSEFALPYAGRMGLIPSACYSDRRCDLEEIGETKS